MQEQLDRIEAKLDQLLERKTRPVKKTNGSLNLMGFDDFWKAYPRKVAKTAAQKAFSKIKVAPSMLIRDIQNRIKNDQQWVAGYIPHPATYLNGSRWEDDLVAVKEKADKLPFRDEELPDWAKQRGYPQAGLGETYYGYRKRLESIHTGEQK